MRRIAVMGAAGRMGKSLTGAEPVHPARPLEGQHRPLGGLDHRQPQYRRHGPLAHRHCLLHGLSPVGHAHAVVGLLPWAFHVRKDVRQRRKFEELFPEALDYLSPRQRICYFFERAVPPEADGDGA